MQTTLSTTSQGEKTTGASSVIAGAADNPSELFTKLLVAQIKNQNPLEPTDPSQFVNQLTQLSQMESLQKLAGQSAAHAGLLQSLQAVQLGTQVGSSVRIRSENVQLADKPVEAGFTLQSASAATTLVLTGTDGAERRIALGPRSPGDVRVAIDPGTLALAPGRYAMRIETDTKETPAIEVSGEISSVKLSPAGKVLLDVSNVGEVTPDLVAEYNGRAAAPSN